MGAGKYNTGAQIAQTIFGINRVQVIAASAVGALIIGFFARLPRFSVKPETDERDHVCEHVTKHEPRLPSFAEESCNLIVVLVVVVTRLSSCSRVFSPRDVLHLQSLPS
jgi:hypothetical protein